MAQPQHPNAPKNNSQQSTAITVAPGVEVLPKERVEYLAETYGLKPPQVIVVRNAICVGATDAELEFFLATCKRLQLDPFARQIWFVKRRQKVEDHFGNESWIDVGRPETGIDGYRTVAERTEQYEGQAPMQWCGPDGKWREVWLDGDVAPAAAKATVFRRGFREPLVNVALFREYCPLLKNGNPTQMWRRMPANQLAKCAEAGAFRKAFPRDLSGITTDTEMEHVDTAAGFSAPPLPAQQPAKQLEETTSVQVPAKVVDAEPAPATAPPQTIPTGDTFEELHAVLAKSEDELDRMMAPLVREVLDAKTREGMQRVGEIISKAKVDEKLAKKESRQPDVYLQTVLVVVKPVLEARWKALAPKEGK